jgi:hypothetical protein
VPAVATTGVAASDVGAFGDAEPDEAPSEAEPEGAVSTDGAPEGAVVDPGPGDPALGGGTVRSLWQYRHLIASSWISSAQYGHFFTIGLHGPSGVSAYRRWPGRFVARLA